MILVNTLLFDESAVHDFLFLQQFFKYFVFALFLLCTYIYHYFNNQYFIINSNFINAYIYIYMHIIKLLIIELIWFLIKSHSYAAIKMPQVFNNNNYT